VTRWAVQQGIPLPCNRNGSPVASSLAPKAAPVAISAQFANTSSRERCCCMAAMPVIYCLHNTSFKRSHRAILLQVPKLRADPPALACKWIYSMTAYQLQAILMSRVAWKL